MASRGSRPDDRSARDGDEDFNAPGHAEFTYTGTNGGSPAASEIYAYDTARYGPISYGATAAWFITSQLPGQTAQSVLVPNNVLVADRSPNGYVTNALITEIYDAIGPGGLTYRGNFYDPSGAAQRAVATATAPSAGPIVWTGNVNMLDGSAADTQQSDIIGGAPGNYGTNMTVKFSPPWPFSISSASNVFVQGVNPASWNGAYGSSFIAGNFSGGWSHSGWPPALSVGKTAASSATR